jgi:3-dehydroshikimate dehydratase
VESKNMPILTIFNTGRDNMIKIGLCSVTFRKLSVEQVIDLCLQAGLEGIEWGGDIHVPSGNDARAAEVAALTEQANLDIVSYGSYYRLGPDEKENVPFEDVLETAVRLKAPAVRVWAGRKGSEETGEKERAEIVRDGQRIVALAEQKGVTVNIEYHGNTLTDTPASADRLMKEIDHPNMRLYWQPAVGESVDRRIDGIRQVLPWLINRELMVRQEAAAILKEIATEESVPALIEALNDDWVFTQKAVLEALGRLKDERAAPALAELLGALQHRAEASRILKEIGPPAEQAVLKQLNHSDLFVRREVCAILAAIGTQKSVSPLTRAARTDPDPFVRNAAQQALRAAQQRRGPAGNARRP